MPIPKHGIGHGCVVARCIECAVRVWLTDVGPCLSLLFPASLSILLSRPFCAGTTRRFAPRAEGAGCAAACIFLTFGRVRTPLLLTIVALSGTSFPASGTPSACGGRVARMHDECTMTDRLSSPEVSSVWQSPVMCGGRFRSGQAHGFDVCSARHKRHRRRVAVQRFDVPFDWCRQVRHGRFSGLGTDIPK